MKYNLAQFFLINLVSWPTPYWFSHCPLFQVIDSSQCLCFHSLQVADHSNGLCKTWCGLLHWDCSWMHPKPAVLRAQCMVCGYSMQATRFERPQVLIALCKSWNNLKKHHESSSQANGHQYAHHDQGHLSNVLLALLQYVAIWAIILNYLSKMEKYRQSTSSKASSTSPNAQF
jgi:hypothetical protein